MKYSQRIGCHNNCIILNFSVDGTYEEEYKHINRYILDGNLMKVYLMIMEGDYCSGDSSWHCYYIIKFSSSPFILQSDLSIDGQVIYSGEMVCEGTYFFQ